MLTHSGRPSGCWSRESAGAGLPNGQQESRAGHTVKGGEPASGVRARQLQFFPWYQRVLSQKLENLAAMVDAVLEGEESTARVGGGAGIGLKLHPQHSPSALRNQRCPNSTCCGSWAGARPQLQSSRPTGVPAPSYGNRSTFFTVGWFLICSFPLVMGKDS